MVKRISATLPFTIEYNKKKFNKIYLSGFPLEGEASLYEQLKDKIGLDFLFDGNPELDLCTQSINDLEAEANCYKSKAIILNSFDHPLRDIKEIVKSIDNRIAITRVIRNHIKNHDKKQEIDANINVMNIELKRFLTEYYLSNENYIYSEKLARECLEYLKLINHEKYTIKHVEEYINGCQILAHHGNRNLLPDPSPNPKSLAAMLEKAETKEPGEIADKEMADKYRSRIASLKQKIEDKNPCFFIKYFSNRLLEKILREGCIPQIEHDRINVYQLEDISSSNIFLNHIVSAYEENDMKIIEVNQTELLPEKMFNLIHEDQYVMLFGRFNSEIRIYKKKMIIKMPYKIKI